MAKVVNWCDICSEAVENCDTTGGSKLISGHLWRYLYHQNVPEELFPPELQVGSSSGDRKVAIEKNRSEMGSQPKLTFALSVTSEQMEASGCHQEGVQFCANCRKKLEVLNKLHQELEGIKRQISAQVEKINKVCKTSGASNHGGNGGNGKLWRKLPKMQMVFAGATMGAENIVKSLTFLSDMCRVSLGASETELKNVTSDKNTGSLENSQCEETKQELPEMPDAQHFEAVENDPLAEFSEVTCDQVVYEYKPEVDIPPEVPSEDFLLEEESDEVDSMPNLLPVTIVAFSGTSRPGTSSQPMPNSLSVSPRSRVKRLKSKGNKITGSSRLSSANKPLGKTRQCTICSKTMARNNLAAHIRSHTGQKLYSCEICGQDFSRRTTYKKHKGRFHSADKLDSATVDTGQT